MGSIIYKPLNAKFKVYNNIYGTYVCDRYLRVKTFPNKFEAEKFMNKNHLNPDYYSIEIVYNVKKEDRKDNTIGGKYGKRRKENF